MQLVEVKVPKACKKQPRITFAQLKALCDSKGYICERYGRKIEVTNNETGVTAIEYSVAAAYAEAYHGL